MKVVVSAASSPQYYGYYLAGLEQALGRLQVRFGTHDLPALHGPRDGMAVVLDDGRRIFIAADDHPDINEEALEWCHAYGKVNLLTTSRNLPGGEKLVALGPGFGIRWGSRVSAIRLVSAASRHDGNQFASGPARWKAYMAHHSQRLPLSEYRRGTSDPDHLFFLATHWARHDQANVQRAELWRRLLETSPSVAEGGFVDPTGSVPPALRASRRYTLGEYIECTRRSVVALNTPAVHGCLGWKLGEFLALGKAIVSLPIAHELPAPLEHGVHLLVGSDIDEMVDHVDRLTTDDGLRMRLEDSAAQYFDAFVSPRAAVDRLLAASRTR